MNKLAFHLGQNSLLQKRSDWSVLLPLLAGGAAGVGTRLGTGSTGYGLGAGLLTAGIAEAIRRQMQGDSDHGLEFPAIVSGLGLGTLGATRLGHGIQGWVDKAQAEAAKRNTTSQPADNKDTV